MANHVDLLLQAHITNTKVKVIYIFKIKFDQKERNTFFLSILSTDLSFSSQSFGRSSIQQGADFYGYLHGGRFDINRKHMKRRMDTSKRSN